jgi:bifunctional non-homologous end joining protein LigD
MTVPHIEPMAAEVGELPPDDGRWAFEPKWDGMRALVELDAGAVRLRARSGRDVTVEFPELAALSTVADQAVLDGEIVALDDAGRPSFARLQPRFGVTDPTVAAARARAIPVTFVAFDLLHLAGHDAWQLPYRDRRALLEQLVRPMPTLLLSPSGEGDGAHWLDAARVNRLEGIMAKRIDRPYEPGRRSGAWRKVKIRHEQEFAVCGWTPGQGRRASAFGALVLGCRHDAAWRWVGNAGTGLTDAELRRWTDELEPAQTPTSPFDEATRHHRALREATWVEPAHVVQVAFTEWTTEGRLRQPSILGRRLDVDTDDVRCIDEVTPSAP